MRAATLCKPWICLIALLLASAAQAACPAGPEGTEAAAAARVQRLLDAMGGRERWAALRGVHIQALHYETDYYQPYRNRLWVDFQAPRMRFEAESTELGKRVRAVSGDAGWRLRDGAVIPLTSEQVAGDRGWWDKHAYRTIHRLATADAGLCPTLAADGRLEILQPDGALLLWYRLAPDGSPVAFGSDRTGKGTIFGPLRSAGPLRMPSFVVNTEGSFRVVIEKVEFDPDFGRIRLDRP